MKRHVRFEKTDFSFTCRGHCAWHSPVKTVRAPLHAWFWELLRGPKMKNRNVNIHGRRWDRVRGDIEGNDRPLSLGAIAA
jgi:hypothetical protein